MLFGLGGTLLDSQRQDLLEVARFWTRKMPKEGLRRIAVDIYKCFEQWKLGQANDNGQVESFHPTTLAMIMASPGGRLAPVSEVLPWHCAGPYVRNEIDLAFKLWLDGYGAFDALIEKHGIPKVFALCGLCAAQNSEIDVSSLIRLNGFLSKHIAQFAEIASSMAMENIKTADQRRRQNAALGRARENSAKNRREKTAQLNDQVRRMAFEYFQQRPGSEIEEAISHIKKYSALSRATIKTKIKGIKIQALRSLNRGAPQ